MALAAYIFLYILWSNIFVATDKLILFLSQPFYNMLLMEVHNMASPDVPVDRVAMQYCMSAAGKDGQYRMHEGEKKEEMPIICIHPYKASGYDL